MATTNSNEPYLDWLSAVLDQEDLPYVISSSYADNEQTVPRSCAEKVSPGVRAAWRQGISLFFGSGDWGVGEKGMCVSNDGKNRSTFLPMFPASCPYRYHGRRNAKFRPRGWWPSTEAMAYVSGGGFSEYFPRPAYQDTAVPAYLRTINGSSEGMLQSRGPRLSRRRRPGLPLRRRVERHANGGRWHKRCYAGLCGHRSTD